MAIQKTDKIWHNGKLINWDDATIHVMSHVIHYGSSVFEGIRCYNGRVFKLTEHVDLQLPPHLPLLDDAAPAPLGVRGWITDSAASALLAHAGLDMGRLRAQAASRDFRPVPTGITLDINFPNRVEHVQSENVVGVVRGRDPAVDTQCVVFTAHWDHLGIGPAVNGDSIYHGAEDNASGVADVLAMARAAVVAPRPRRSLLFVFVTAEESGLLGSAYFAQHPGPHRRRRSRSQHRRRQRARPSARHHRARGREKRPWTRPGAFRVGTRAADCT